MAVGNINDIFNRAKSMTFSNENSIPPVVTGENFSSPSITSISPSLGNRRSAVSKRVALESLPLIESADTFVQQAELLSLHIKANLTNQGKVNKLISEWVDVILDENKKLSEEFKASASKMSKEELLVVIEALTSKLY